MMRRTMYFALLLVLAFSTVPLSAHDEFRIIGTVTRFEYPELDVKTKEGRTTTIAMDKQTEITRDKKKVEITQLKKGQSVVVTAFGDGENDLLASDVRIVPPIAPSKTK